MAKIPEYLNTLNGWVKLLAALVAHAAELPYLAEPASRLANLLQQANGLSTEYSALTGTKQDIGRRLQQALREGDALAAFLRSGARERFGNRSELLVEFGMQPFRSRLRSVKPPPPVTPDPETPAPPPATE